MKKKFFIVRFFIIIFLVIVFSQVFTIGAFSAEIQVNNIQIVDTTPFEFSISWHSSISKTFDISVFSDSNSQTNISNELNIYNYPVSNNKNINSLWPQKATISGCLPDTTYFTKLNFQDNINFYEKTIELKTTKENSFIIQSKQLFLEFVQNDKTPDLSGSMVTIKTNETLYPVSTFISYNNSLNQAFIDLNQLFISKDKNWTPVGTKEIIIDIYGLGKNPVQRIIPIEFTEDFIVSHIEKILINCPPVIKEISNKQTDEDTSISINLLISDIETKEENLTLSFQSSNQSLIPDSNISLNDNDSDQTLLITPALNQSGLAHITVTVFDGYDTDFTSFDLFVKPVDDPNDFKDFDIYDLMLVLSILNNSSPDSNLGLFKKADINGDGIISLTESIYLFEIIAGIKELQQEIISGDIDGSGQIDLIDVFNVLSMLTTNYPDSKISTLADVNGDKKIGLEEVIFILQVISKINEVLPGDVDNNKVLNLEDVICILQSSNNILINCNIHLEADMDHDNKISIQEAIYVLEQIIENNR